MAGKSQKISDQLDQRIESLVANGVIVPDPRQIYIGPEVSLQNIHPEVVLYPGVRLEGHRTILGPRARIGSEGPATINDVAADQDTEIASGYVTNSVLLRGARIGANGHVRACTIIEEEASTAHAVGLKQTILMCYATLGSLINFCDGIVSGGSSRADHTEVGSGFIHFNFTPWGARGDKATPTLVGDVYGGVFLNRSRIFLGGLSGMIGPRHVGFGALTVAGQTIRDDVGDDMLVSTTAKEKRKSIVLSKPIFSKDKYEKNRYFISNLAALREWYRQIRLSRASHLPEGHYKTATLCFAIELINAMVDERMKRLREYLDPFGHSPPALSDAVAPCPVQPQGDYRTEHIAWVKSLSRSDVELLHEWLREVGDAIWRH